MKLYEMTGNFSHVVMTGSYDDCRERLENMLDEHMIEYSAELPAPASDEDYHAEEERFLSYFSIENE